jgi:LCP family protein required for cell wall assembly
VAPRNETRGKHARPASSVDTVRIPANEAGAAVAADFDRGSIKYGAAKKVGMATWKKALLAVLSVVLVLVGAAAAYAGWYMSKINEALSIDGEDQEALSQVTETVDLSKPFYMLVMGSDSRNDASATEADSDSRAGERSDVIILARIDAPNRKVTLVSIPRDTPYTMEDGTVCKINETYNTGGAAGTIKAVEETTGVDISHYAELRFSDLENMVDALDGITVNVDTALSYKDALTGERVTIDAGEQTLTGQQAQIFVRARHEYATDQDVHRQNNVRQLATAMMNAVLDEPVSKIPDTVLELAKYVGTDLNATDLLKLASSFAGGNLTVYSCTGPNLGDFSEENGGIWLCYRNPEGWAGLMKIVDAGEDPSGFDANSLAERPETSGSSSTEGTAEPTTDESGAYIPQDYQESDGGYVEPYGTYYYEDAAASIDGGATQDATADAGGTAADGGVVDAGGGDAPVDTGGAADGGGGAGAAEPAVDAGGGEGMAAAAGGE